MQYPKFSLTVISLSFSLFATYHVNAQTKQKLSIDGVTVFLSGAELVSHANLALAKGENEIIFTNVAGDVNNKSLAINATNGIVVESATFQNNYLAAEILSPKAQEIKDSIELVRVAKEAIDNRIKVLNQQLAIVTANQKVAGDNTGLSVAELTKMLDLVNIKMENYLNQRTAEETRQVKLHERLARLRKQLEEEQKKEYQPGGQLIVKFYAKEATATAVTINYVVPNAGWSPSYDVFADNIKDPLKLFYKANIYQNSGVKWDNVHLTLSTGDPDEDMQAPALEPWYLAFYSPVTYAWAKGKDKKMKEARTIESLSTDTTISNDYVLGNAAPTESTVNDHVSVDNAGVNASFDIDLPYTIPSDGQEHLVAVKKYELPASYRYFAVPKLDKDAFLQAEITNWEDLNLLPGQTNIFYEGTYVGQGTIDVSNTKDTMTISLGRDKKIVVKRDRDTKLRSVKTIGTNVRETFAYTITIRNTRKENINLIVQDQQPVSNDKDIVIEDKETGGSEYNETTGMMSWSVSLNANETKTLSFGYTIKYPKGKTIKP